MVLHDARRTAARLVGEVLAARLGMTMIVFLIVGAGAWSVGKLYTVATSEYLRRRNLL
jgi:hypothetical protein